MKKSYLPLHNTTTLNIICESSRKLWQFQNLIIFSCSAMVLWCMIQDLLHVPISFLNLFFFLLSLYYINLNFDCPFNTKVIQTLNDEFKSQKTLKQRKFPCERNRLRVLFSPNHFNICTANSVWFFWCQVWKCRKYRPIFVPFVFPRDPRTLVAWCVDKIEQQSTILVCNDKKSFSCQWRLTQKKVKGQDKKSLARQVVYWWNTNTFLGKNTVDF